MPLTRPGPHIE